MASPIGARRGRSLPKSSNLWRCSLGSNTIPADEAILHKLIHVLCALVCVAIIGGMMTRGVSDLRHDVSHASSEFGDEIGHDHADIPSDVIEISAEPADVDAPSGTLPAGHHHHGGGDNHAALPDHQVGLIGLVNARGPTATLGASQLPEGLIIDGPEHPPKQLHLIA